MPISDQTLTVEALGEVTIQVPCAPGTRVRVLVLDPAAESAADPSSAAATQVPGFVARVLADPAEEVWNDL